MAVALAPQELRSLGDIRSAVLGVSGELSGNTTINNRIDLFINQRHREILGQKFDFCFVEDKIVLLPLYETGTVSVNQDSTTVTGVNTVWTAAAHLGQKIKFNGWEEIYRISAVGGNTSITLDKAFQGSNVSAGSYSIIIDAYDLPSNFDEIVAVWDDQKTDMTAEAKPLREFTELQLRSPLSEGSLRCYSIDYEGNSGIPRLRVWPVADDNRMIHVLYQRRIPGMVKDETFLKDDVSLNGATVSSFDHTASFEILTYITFDGSVAGSTGNVTLTGTGWLGGTITETVVLNGTSEVKSASKYKTITSIVLPSSTGTVDIGIDTAPLLPAKHMDALFWGPLADVYEFQGEETNKSWAEGQFTKHLAKIQQNLDATRQPLRLMPESQRRSTKLSPATMDLGSLFDRS